MTNFKRKIGIVLIVGIILCLICGIVIYILGKNESEVNMNPTVFEEEKKVEYLSEKLKDPTKFFSVQTCIQNNIDKNFIAKDMNILEGDRIFNYSVYGTIEKNKEVYFIVSVDIENMTFLIEELDIDYNNIDEIDLQTDIEKINFNGKNNFEYTTVSDEDMCRIYLKHFLELELEDITRAYSLLNEEYKQERFPVFNEYQEYVKEYREIIEDCVLSKYSVKYYDNYTQYILVDTYNNSYTLDATSVMNYTIKLDNYTIKVDTYEKDYNKLSDSNKVQSNVYIFLQMINTKDYKHAYALLDETFKSSKFDTLEKFKRYVQNNFFNYNLNASNINIEVEGNYYIYETIIKESSSSAADSKKLTVIMKLEEGTDFVISFNIE